MRLLTGNDLKTGAVTWWTGSDWSIHVEDAADVAGSEDEIARREQMHEFVEYSRRGVEPTNSFETLCSISGFFR